MFFDSIKSSPFHFRVLVAFCLARSISQNVWVVEELESCSLSLGYPFGNPLQKTDGSLGHHLSYSHGEEIRHEQTVVA